MTAQAFPSIRGGRIGACRLLIAGLTLLPLAAFSAEKTANHAAGLKVYKNLCASCHGADGQGVRDKYSDPLVGDRSLDALTRYIEKQMPEEKPGTCIGEDAKQVAAYIFDAFYSSEAQLRHNPPRAAIARLTVDQYRNTIADLISVFHGQAKADETRGLKVEYFNDKRGFNKDKRVMEQVEPTLQVSFDKKPADKIDQDEYAIRWSGSVLAPETGDYDFILQCPNGAKLWVNDRDKPLIDVWVRSGDDPRHVASLRLLAGRTYFLRVEVAKEKKEKTLAAELRWKPPHLAEERIPQRLLSPGGDAQWLVLQTPFPPDDNSLGYEHGAAVSQAWDEATTQAAFEVANYVTARLQRISGTRADDGNQAEARKKLIAFCRRFADQAFRRPLDDEQARFFVDRVFAGDAPLEAAVRRSLLLVLKSQRFLFPGLINDPRDGYAVAARLSYTLWDSLPDAKLLEAAKAGRLANRDGVAKEAERMLQDPRARTKMRAFYHRLLKLEDLHGLAKENGKFPGFDPELVADLRTSLDLFLDDVTWDSASDYRRLMLTDTLMLNGRLAKFYGADLPADAPFTKVTLANQPHAGVLTHPLIMAGFSYATTSSPIHRGVFVSRNLLGRRLRSPPDSVVPLSPEMDPSLTTRQRIGKQTKPASCMSCHDMINPLGFTMEGFDAVGRFRKDELSKPIDTSGSYRRKDGEVAQFKDVRDLGTFLAESAEAQGAFVERLFKESVKQPILAYGPVEKERLRVFFSEHGCSIRALLGEIAISSALAPSAPSSLSVPAATSATPPAPPKAAAK